jgi:hypothetical protein
MALKVQRAYRGHIGRRKIRIIREIREVGAFGWTTGQHPAAV